MREPWPLTGRAAELAFISGAVQRPARSPGIVLSGAAGVGKSRLAREALERITPPRAMAHWVVGTASARGVPLGAFASVVGFSGEVRGFEDVVGALSDGSGPGFVVGVDDAHHLDEVSAHVLHQLVLRNTAPVIVTVRGGEPAPDAVTALWKDGYLPRLEIQPLAEGESQSLLDAVLGDPIDTAAAHRLWSLTRGNVLFLRQLVIAEAHAGRLREVGRVWRWDGEATLPVPLAELVEGQMGVLTDEVCDVVDLLALGEPLDHSAIGRLAVHDAVEVAEGQGLVTVSRSSVTLEARLAHPLFGEVRRARMGEMRGRRLRELLAGALTDDAGRPELALRRAVLFLEAGLEPDAALFTAAARTAMTLGDLSLAQRLAEQALHAGAGFEAMLVHAYAIGFQGRGAEAEVELAALEGLASGDIDRLLVTAVRAANLFWTLCRPADAEALLDERMRDIADNDLVAPLAALQAAFYAFLGRSEPAVTLARQALQAPWLPTQSIIMTAYGLVAGLGVTGRHSAEFDEAANRGYIAGRSFETTFMRHGLVQVHLLALRLAGRISDANDVAQRTKNDMFETGIQLYTAVTCGQGELIGGRLATAIRWLREAQAGLPLQESHGHEYLSAIWLTQALAMAGDAAEARRMLHLLEANSHPGFVFVAPDVLLARAWVAAAEGAISEATSLASDAAALAASRKHFAYEVFALHNAVCLGEAAAASRLVELAALVDGPHAPAAAAHAVALVNGDGDGLRSASDLLAGMGDMLCAADAAAQAAEAYRREGRKGSGIAAAARAHQLAELCEGARTPAVLAAARPLPLTLREREIVALAAQGHSNRQIADRLVLSVRTVEGHLYRAHAKLGTTDRSEFASLMGIDA